MSLAPDDPRHGTANGYVNCGCRCDDCRIGWAAYYGGYVQGPCPGCGGTLSNRYTYKLCRSCYEASVPEPLHGTESRYTKRGCRCDLCRAASAAGRRRRRHAVAA